MLQFAVEYLIDLLSLTLETVAAIIEIQDAKWKWILYPIYWVSTVILWGFVWSLND